jgi:LacI family transcriptional regulator
MPKTRRVALILDTNRPYQRKIVRGVAAYARQSGRWSLYVEDEPLDKLPNLRLWHGQGIITTFIERKYAEAVRGLSIPVVGIEGGYGWYEADSNIPYFATDDEAIARMAAEHLMGQGYRRLAYCGVPRNRYNAWSQKRAKAFRQAARDAKLPCSIYTGRILSTRKWTALQRELIKWLRSLKKPVGIMAANDARARHLLEACRAVGIRVPEDVAVLGVDNDELMCELMEPPLTSIEQGARGVGYRAAELLDRMMSGKRPPKIVNFVPPERVIVRRSTDYLAIDDADVAAAVRYIREHACEHMKIGDILDAVGVSRSTLGVRFKKSMGKTIHEEILDTMLSHARRLIAAGKLTLKQVAAEAGFATVQHMTNRFREFVGQTPSEYQKMVTLGLPYPPAASDAAS